MKTCAAIWTTLSAALVLWLWPSAGGAAGCERIVFEDLPYTVCTADPRTDTIRLALNDDAGNRLGTFDRLAAAADGDGQSVVFAMNAGMYHPDRSPVGLYIEDGQELARIVTREGPGNFGLLPNGVLCLSDGSAAVIESRDFAASRPACRHATQSGPMLVIDGQLHPRFLVGSASRLLRNGVGVTAQGMLIAAISDAPVNFHTFGRLFRDRLKTPNALFLDGKVSRLYAPAIGRQDIGFPVGPMLAVLRPAD